MVSGTGAHTRASAGRDYNCGIQDAVLKCWGRNDDGQLGDGSTQSRYAPAGTAISTGWVTVSAGGDYTVGTRDTD